MTVDELFLTAILDCTRSDLYLHPRVLTDAEQFQLDERRARHKAGEPVQYLNGFTEFYGYRFEVGPGVLIPRPETEILAELVIRSVKADRRRDIRILDIGTGSGCLAISLARELPECRVVAIDVSETALVYARRNSVLNGTLDRVACVQRDMFWFLDETAERFDVVVSNPPYIPGSALGTLPADVRHEPELALDGGPDGLHFYRFLVPASWKVLVPGGLLAVEFGDGQAKELENLFAVTGPWDKIKIHQDNAGKARIMTARKVI